MFYIYFCSSDACGIDLGESYILTAGNVWTGSSWVYDSKVSNYSTTGWTEDLPDLNIARRYHACSFYTTDSGDNVGFTSILLLTTDIFLVLRFSWSQEGLVVAGGWTLPKSSPGTMSGVFSLLLPFHHLPPIFLLERLTTPSL